MWDGPTAALEQAVRLAGPGATVRAVRALGGGTAARTSLIQTANPQLEVVLREFPPGDDAAGREANVLRVLNGLSGLAPRLLASDVAVTAAGGSWLLISRLPGGRLTSRRGSQPRRPGNWAGSSRGFTRRP